MNQKKLKEDIYLILYPYILDIGKRMEISDEIVNVINKSIEFPTDDEINNQFPDPNDLTDFEQKNISWGSRYGAKWMRHVIKKIFSEK